MPSGLEVNELEKCKYKMFRGGKGGWGQEVGTGGREVTEAQGGGDVGGGQGAIPSQTAQSGKQHVHPLVFRRHAAAVPFHARTLDHVRCCIGAQKCLVTSAMVRGGSSCVRTPAAATERMQTLSRLHSLLRFNVGSF